MRQKDSSDGQIGNFCVAFIDLLGQRRAMHGQTIITPKNKDQVERAAKSIIQPILSLHDRAETLLEKSNSAPNSPIRATLDGDELEKWDRASYANIKWQRWSDGIVYYSSIGDSKLVCKAGPAHQMIGFAGALCLMCLGAKMPLRGAIEIGWASEIYKDKDEIYGPAVANAYLLESEVAKYPRMVVGGELLKFLEVAANSEELDSFSTESKVLANLALTYLAKDLDGRYIVNYLGKAFGEFLGKNTQHQAKERAFKFVTETLLELSNNGDPELVSRYNWLLSYFEYDHENMA
jgi:hypothetical protein